MTWQLIVFALLALVIAGGVAWYERSRPPARVVALVAALAALAVAGRLVLAPVPNVVATTDIALITGYALGGAPGFVVGALAAPISNLWLGQGPWTPWQMAGWGMCGIAGAALARASGRRLGRLGLATACAAAGLAYGALLDLSVMVTYGGEQSLDRYLALSARGVPFNIAHAAGNFVIALAVGPDLVRMISRFRERLEFTWRPATVAPALLLVLAAAGTTLAPEARAGSPADARIYLERQQNSDGGFGAVPRASSNVDMTAWAMLGLEAAGRNPLDLRSDGRTPVDYLRSKAGDIRSTPDLEKTILALAGAGVSPRSFDGHDLVAALKRTRRRDGSWSGYVDLTAFGVFALRAGGAGSSALKRSGAWLRRAQNDDAGWGTRPGSASTVDSTGSALQALALSGGGPSIANGVAFLRRAQSSDGGFASPGAGSNSQSTAWAIQGLVAAGANPGAVSTGGRSPLDYLAARQAPDGHYRYSAGSDQTPIWVTSQALLAVEREAFPVSPTPRAAKPGGLPPAGGNGLESGAGEGGDGGGTGGTGESGEPKHRGGERGNDGARGSAGEDPGGSKASRLAAAQLSDIPSDPDEAGTRVGDANAYLLGALAGLALALAGGFVWYRRRLP